MTSGCRKGVSVAVYTETPRNGSFITNNSPCQRYHLFVHQKGRQERGYNRRAELLDYMGRLRESAKPQKTPLLDLQPELAVSPLQSGSQKITPAKNKFKPVRVPTCFGTLTIRLPTFSGVKGQRRKKNRNSKRRIRSIVSSFWVQSKGGFFLKNVCFIKKKAVKV